MPPRRLQHAAHLLAAHSDAKKLPSAAIFGEPDAVQTMLEELDDAVFAALGGDEQALEATRELWPKAVAELSWEHVEPSREQYLRYAVETTRRLQEEGLHRPELSLAAIEVISLLAR